MRMQERLDAVVLAICESSLCWSLFSCYLRKSFVTKHCRWVMSHFGPSQD